MKLRLPKTRRFRIYIYVASTVLVLVAADLLWVRICRHITLAYDTTRITVPLKPDGTPDYAAYLTQIASQGVTPENNAAVPLFQRMPGPQLSSDLWPHASEKFYGALGITAPIPSAVFIPYDTFLHSDGWPVPESPDAKNFEQALAHPWRASDYPRVAAWLDANAHVLDCLPQMAQRTRFYAPLITGPNKSISGAITNEAGSFHQVFLATLAQAQRLAGEGQVEEAHALLLSCHRASRLVAQSLDTFPYLVAISRDNFALNADTALYNLPNLSPVQLKRFAADADALPPFPSPATCIDNARYVALETVIQGAQAPEQVHKFLRQQIEASGPSWQMVVAEQLIPFLPAHYNAALRQVNALFDDYVNASKAPTAVTRDNLEAAASNRIDELARKYSGVMSDPAMRYMIANTPHFGRLTLICDSHEVRLQLTRLALALAAYRLDYGQFPDTLVPLAPVYIPAIPQDPFNEQPLRYARTTDGYELSSVGGVARPGDRINKIAVQYPPDPLKP